VGIFNPIALSLSKGDRIIMNDPAASGGVSQGNWMIGAASGGESDPSERPEAHSPIIPEK
jgi:hypothetical protein